VPLESAIVRRFAIRAACEYNDDFAGALRHDFAALGRSASGETLEAFLDTCPGVKTVKLKAGLDEQDGFAPFRKSRERMGPRLPCGVGAGTRRRKFSNADCLQRRVPF
jgi:hypothetical protein